MFNFIKNIFKKEKEELKEELTAENLFKDDIIEREFECINCPLKKVCKSHSASIECEDAINMDNFDDTKDTILVIDDHEGIISFLKDDMEFFNEKGIIKLNDVNLLLISGSYAAFTLKLLYDKIGKLNIKWAIIDITLGGSKMTPEGNIKYTGVDVFDMIYKKDKPFKYLFYTGNNLNPHIRSNQKIIEQFKNITNENLNDHILFKTSMDMNTRRKYITKHLFELD